MTSTIPRPAIPQSAPRVDAPVGSDSRAAVLRSAPKVVALREPNSRPTSRYSVPNAVASDGVQLAARQNSSDAHHQSAGSDQQGRGRAAGEPSIPNNGTLLDPALSLAADFLDDMERVKIANENRLRSLTRVGTDSDGVDRYIGLEADHPVVAQLAKMVESLAAVEHDAVLTLQRMVRKHPLGAWIKTQKGIGEKQGARLLASIGDPYWRPEIVRGDGTAIPEGPRTASALWAYCGLHVLPAAGQASLGVQTLSAGGGDSTTGGDPGHGASDAHAGGAGVAARRRRGQQANWSEKARMRAWNVAESCKKQLVKPCTGVTPDSLAVHVDDCQCGKYRLVYDAGRAKYLDSIHTSPCVRCGPKGRPAAIGSPLSNAHKEARAHRLVSKEILKDLWRAGRDWHLAQKESS